MKIKNYILSLSIFASSFAIAQTGISITDSILSDGVYRKFLVYVPTIYTSANAVPLVFNIHGWTGHMEWQQAYADFRKIADTANFIVVHPQALGSVPSWNNTEAQGPNAKDKNFLIHLLDTLRTRYTINTNRVYATGFSQGGFMSYDFACFYSTHFAAIASVSAGIKRAHYPICNAQHPMPVMEIHGTADVIDDYMGDSGSMSVDSTIRYWVNFNSCDTTPVATNLPDINTSDSCTVVHYVYSGGTGGSKVELYKVVGGNHQWPADVPTSNVYGVGYRNKDFNASKEIWRFFGEAALSVEPHEQLGNNNVTVYPNPSNGVFTVEFKGIQNGDITIYNLFGEVILKEKSLNESTLINLSGLPKGIYFYQAGNQTEIIKTGKLFVQ